MVETIFDRSAPSFAISLEDIRLFVFSAQTTFRLFKLPETPGQIPLMTELSGVCESLCDVLFQRGHRRLSSLMTRQEHALMGSGVDVPDPYIPVGFVTGKLSLEETRLARERRGFFPGLIDFFIGLEGRSELSILEMYLRCTFEPLDEHGRTARDPRVLSLEGDKLVVVESTTKSPDFKFPRK